MHFIFQIFILLAAFVRRETTRENVFDYHWIGGVTNTTATVKVILTKATYDLLEG